MENLEQQISALKTIRKRLDDTTWDYIRTTPFCTYEVNGQAVQLDVRDLLLIGAITESDILLIGKTGSGKTRLANGLMKALFGPEGYYSKTTLPTMNATEFMDIDFPAILEGRKTLREAVSGIPSLVRPGIVLNEVNRAPSVVQSLLIPFLDRELEVQGIPVEMGKPWEGGRYQFRILTINEGEVYQVQELDPAIRDRMTIEIPVDAFPQNKMDVISMLRRSGTPAIADVAARKNAEDEVQNCFDLVTGLRSFVESMEVPDEIHLFLSYLSGLSYCVKAPRGNKESIALSAEVCAGCHHTAAFYNLCGNILAPSARILLRLQRVAKAFALFRLWYTQKVKDFKVTPEDIIAAAPFVLYSKLSLHPNWVRTAGDRSRPLLGDRWTAIREILAWVYEARFPPVVDTKSEIGECFYLLSRGSKDKEMNRSLWERVLKYLMEKDPWAYDPAEARQALARFK